MGREVGRWRERRGGEGDGGRERQGGRDVEGEGDGESFKRQGIYVCAWVIHFAVQQKIIQHGEVAILQ